MVLIIYSTTDGQTLKICQRIKSIIADHDQTVKIRSVTEDNASLLELANKIIIGASIRYGRHSRDIYRFIQNHQSQLEAKPNAFFTVNVVARKPNKNTPETNPYLKKFLKQIDWKPNQLAVFAGKINYPIYSFFDRHIIRLIMWLTNGPTGANDVVEFTDWDKVEQFAKSICES